MEIQANTVANPPIPTSATESTLIDSDFQTFLQMLTVQMQNQDPLNPVNSEDLAVQLATFSGVEQQVLTNGLLRELTSGLAGLGQTQMASWIGMDVRAPAAAEFSGTPIDIFAEIPASADSAELVVRSPDGTELQRLAVPPQSQTFTWAGVSATGDPMPNAAYSFEIIPYRGSDPMASVPGEVYSTVTEAQIVAGGVSLILASGGQISTDQVSGIRSGPE